MTIVTTIACEKSDSLERTKTMKHLFAITVLLLAACGQTFGDMASDEREVTQLIKDFNAALVKADTAFLDKVLAPDFVHYRPKGDVENRAEYLEHRKNGGVHFESLVADDIKVRFYGDAALVTYRSTAKGKDQHGTIDEQRLWTRVFVRKDRHWQLVHSQGTTIQKP
jgi:ketosteroid isomerase-like protein